MAQFEKIPARQALQEIQDDALLINGYDEKERWNETRVDNAISFPEFKAQLASLPKDKELIFYCDCDNDKTAVGRAAELAAKGYSNIKVVDGGFKALQKQDAQGTSAANAS